MKCGEALLLALALLACRCASDSGVSTMASLSAEAEDSGSIEIPVRRQRSGPYQHRPILELVLGVLDTFHSSSKSELRRIEARRARQNEPYAAVNFTANEVNANKGYSGRGYPAKRRLISAKY